MNLQEKLFEASADLRARATALTAAALDLARARATVAAGRVEVLKGSLSTLSDARRTFRKVAQRHASRFVKENADIAIAAGKDVSALARSTYATLAGSAAPKAKARKPRASSKRATKKAA
jgi:ATP/maltotriose-dependent transcriptional regulator MalT